MGKGEASVCFPAAVLQMVYSASVVCPLSATVRFV